MFLRFSLEAYGGLHTKESFIAVHEQLEFLPLGNMIRIPDVLTRLFPSTALVSSSVARNSRNNFIFHPN